MSNNISKKSGRQQQELSPAWSKLAELVGQNVEVTVDSENKSNEGRVCGVNVTWSDGEGNTAKGFNPMSELPRDVKPSDLVGQTLSVRAVEVDATKKGGRFLVSRKAAIADLQRAYIETLHKGDKVSGVVTSAVALSTGTAYFVRISNGEVSVDAQLHEMQIPLRKGEKQTLNAGDTVEAAVLGANVENCKVSLTQRPPRSEQRKRNARNDSYQGRGNGAPRHNASRSGNNGAAAGSAPAAKQAAKPVRKPTPPKDRPSTPHPVKSRKGEFDVTFSSADGNPFAALAQYMTEKNDTGAQASEPAAAVQPAPETTEPAAN